jgi:hypothetical protein
MTQTEPGDLEIERDALGLVTDCISSLHYLEAITLATFGTQGDELSLRAFYDEYLRENKIPRKIIPFTRGAIIGLLYVGILFTKENWFELLPDDLIQKSDEDWGLREAKVIGPTLILFRLIGLLAERVGFEPTVRLPVQRFSTSKTLVLERVVW